MVVETQPAKPLGWKIWVAGAAVLFVWFIWVPFVLLPVATACRACGVNLRRGS